MRAALFFVVAGWRCAVRGFFSATEKQERGANMGWPFAGGFCWSRGDAGGAVWCAYFAVVFSGACCEFRYNTH